MNLFEAVCEGARIAGADAPAVVGSDVKLSFGELVDGARRLAARLHREGIGRGHRVALWMDKSPRCVQALLGILASGAAYVPLDPRSPWRRCRAIVENCGVAALFVDGPRVAMVTDLLDGLKLRLVVVDGVQGPGALEPLFNRGQTSTFDAAMATSPVRIAPSAPEDVAYILYTSGSTGTPKGVTHTHHSGLDFARWVQRTIGVTPKDVFASHAPFHFDLSISDLFAGLSAGASVRLISAVDAMVPPYLVTQLATWGITVWYSVPSVLAGMADRGGLDAAAARTLRVVMFAGEVFPTPQLRRVRRAIPHVRLLNLFGPTETNVCTWYEVPPDLADEQTAPIPIGRACDNMETFLIDDQGREIRDHGVEGTLWARGGNLMTGYWNDRARTDTMLRPDPRGKPGLAYCTGDRATLRPDGDYDFHGRRDHMVKTRGFRVELGEVESVLAAYPGVLEAIAVPLPDPALGNRIVATVVPADGQQLDGEAVREFCAERLPSYMVPEVLEVRPELPRTSTSKADRMALREQWLEREGT